MADSIMKEPGIRVVLDVLEMHAGKNLHYFAEKSIEEADKIIVIFTPAYKYKAERREGASGFEYSIIATILARNIAGQHKIIPILRSS